MWMSSIPYKGLATSRCLAHGFTAITVFGLPVLGGIEGWSGSGRHPVKDNPASCISLYLLLRSWPKGLHMGIHLSQRLSECSVLWLTWFGLKTWYRPITFSLLWIWPPKKVVLCMRCELPMSSCDWWPVCARDNFKDTRGLSLGGRRLVQKEKNQWKQKKLPQSWTASYFPRMPGCIFMPCSRIPEDPYMLTISSSWYLGQFE